jgi:hypothetical protein
MSTIAELNELIAQQSITVGSLKTKLKTDSSDEAKAAADAGVKHLRELNAKLVQLGGGKKDDKKAVKFTLKTPKVCPFSEPKAESFSTEI